MAFLHGVEVIELSDGVRAIRLVGTSVIGLVGTAWKGPVNEAVLIKGNPATAATTFGKGFGTLPDAFDAIFAQVGALVYAVNVLDPATHKTTVAAADMAWANGKIQLANTHVLNVVVKQAGGSGSAYGEGTDYELDEEAGTITVIAGGNIDVSNQANVGYDYLDASLVDAPTIAGGLSGAGVYTGVSALLGAGGSSGSQRPKIMIAPGYSSTKTVADALMSAADKRRGVAVIEGPNTTDAAAIAYRGTLSGRRGYLVDPSVRVLDADGDEVTRPNSAYVAGAIARSDNDPARGWWWSPSNYPILGIEGTARGVDFSLGDETSPANLLNADEVATIIQEDGFRLWGNRTLSDDPKWAFLSTVRINDAINESILRSHMWAVDRPFSRTYLQDVAEGVNAFLRELRTMGAILGGTCVPSPTNTPEKVAAGNACWDYEFTDAKTTERLTFRSRLTDDYIEDELI